MPDVLWLVRGQFANTGGFSDHVFAACAILGYRFAPRIQDLPSKRLYAFNPSAAPAHLRALIGGKINQALIERNWPDILRIAATIAAGVTRLARFCASSPLIRVRTNLRRPCGKSAASREPCS